MEEKDTITKQCAQETTMGTVKESKRETKMSPNLWDKQVDSLHEYAKRIARDNIQVILHIGKGTPTAVEVPLYEAAIDIKQRFMETK